MLPVRSGPTYAGTLVGDAIRTHGLTKDYGRGKGLFDLSFTIRAGEIVGYLGPNGAGKTTTIRLLMGLIRPTRGTAEVFGLDVVERSVDVKGVVGYLPGELPQFGGLRGSEVVASLAALRPGVDRRRIREISERLDLDLGRPYRQYSRGNKQKLAIVTAFMHRPRLLILDEPTGGLDPLNQQEFHRMVREERDAGATVFLSSHVLSEVAAMCDRVAIVRAGRLVKVAELHELNELHLQRVEVEFAGAPPLEALRAVPNLERLEVNGLVARGILRGDAEAFLRALVQGRPVRLTSEEPTLEESFLAYYGDRPDASA